MLSENILYWVSILLIVILAVMIIYVHENVNDTALGGVKFVFMGLVQISQAWLATNIASDMGPKGCIRVITDYYMFLLFLPVGIVALTYIIIITIAIINVIKDSIEDRKCREQKYL